MRHGIHRPPGKETFCEKWFDSPPGESTIVSKGLFIRVIRMIRGSQLLHFE